MNITIKNASIKKILFLKYGYDHFVNNTKFSHSTTGDAPIHEDLQAAFDELTPHFALICEEITEQYCRQAINDLRNNVIKNEETDPLRKYVVTGFTVGKDSDGVSIIGTKRLNTGKVLNITTPFMKWDDEHYPLIHELIEAVDLCKSEVYEYIEGKRAPLKNQTLDMFEQAEEEPVGTFEDAEM